MGLAHKIITYGTEFSAGVALGAYKGYNLANGIDLGFLPNAGLVALPIASGIVSSIMIPTEKKYNNKFSNTGNKESVDLGTAMGLVLSELPYTMLDSVGNATSKAVKGTCITAIGEGIGLGLGYFYAK